MYNTIHYVRAIEAQKSLTRVQRIKNKLRIFGKKKIAEKKIEKEPLPDSPVIVDIEMADVEPIGKLLDRKFLKQTQMEHNVLSKIKFIIYILFWRFEGIADGLWDRISRTRQFIGDWSTDVHRNQPSNVLCKSQ